MFMKIAFGNMSFREILSNSLRLLLSRFPVVYLVNLIVFLPVLALQLGAPSLMRSRLNSLPGGAGLGVLLVLTLTYFLTPFAGAVVFYIFERQLNNEQVGLLKAFQLLTNRFNKLLKTSLWFALLIISGLALVYIPGILFMVWYALISPVIIAEGYAGMPALHRSKELTNGFRLKIFGIILLLLLASLAFQGLMAGASEFLQVIASVPDALSSSPEFVLNYGAYVLVTLVTYLLNTLIYTYQAVSFTLIYFELHARRESLSLNPANHQQVVAAT
jgi:hypothetical protein